MSSNKVRRDASGTDDSEHRPLAIASDYDDEKGWEGNDGRALGAPPSTPPPIFRHVRDTHPPPSYAHVIINRYLLRVFPRVLAVLLVSTFVVALLPGGWRVGLCAMNVIPFPELVREENVTIIGHRGCEFPYPGNSLEALDAVMEATDFVEIDVGLTSDKEVVLSHDMIYDLATTNGTGLICMHPLSYTQSLALKTPERNPQGRIAHGRFCTRPRHHGVGTIPCTYRIPTLSSVFDELPTSTRFMIDVKACFAPGIEISAALCSNCTALAISIEKTMLRHFISPERVVFTSSQQASLAVFRNWPAFANASFAIGVDPQRYSHYKPSTLTQMLDDRGFDAVSMHVGLAAIRPDLLSAVRNSQTPDKSRNRDVYVWTIRREIDYKLARCAGASRLIAAEPDRLKKQITWKDVGSLLGETT